MVGLPLGDLTTWSSLAKQPLALRGSTHCRLVRVVRHRLMCDGLKDRAPRHCEKGNGSELLVSRNWPGTLGLRLNSLLTWRLMHVTGPPRPSSSSSDYRLKTSHD
jgi:hypothetical protein